MLNRKLESIIGTNAFQLIMFVITAKKRKNSRNVRVGNLFRMDIAKPLKLY